MDTLSLVPYARTGEGRLRYWHRDTCLPDDRRYIPLRMEDGQPVEGTGVVVAVERVTA